MGIYDRDWWRDRYNQQSGKPRKDAAWRRPEKDGDRAAKAAVYNPRAFRAESPKNSRDGADQRNEPPELPGAQWHWTIKLLWMAGVGTVLLIIAKNYGRWFH
ncbi:hypothetical protein RN01_02190 [Cupriavidus sp. SHE]|uniref:hypothetical protein n=1 Tax=Cupriavidus sp. SHE TaxID=1539143 RepID=UPI0005727E70|nr:hypothetical protein [Cupriavidus sp. SHE]KWR86420.1 hypothetical protein RN01_02190 [Cupriavidus sp. SHE]